MKQKAKDQVVDQEQVVVEQELPQADNEPQVTDNVTDESFETSDIQAELTAEIKEWQDKYLRLSAEFDNFRKRTLKEKMELIQTGNEEVIKSVLGVVDDFDRAMEAMAKTQDVESVKEGVALINQKLVSVLKAKGVEEIEAIGLPLDTDFHDAVAKFPVEESSKKGKIIDIVQKGYKMNDKVIRFAKVVVGE